MALNCLICMSTPNGTGYTEVRINSLHQLAMLMPGHVVTYEVCQQLVTNSGARVEDAELFDLLIWAVSEIGVTAPAIPTHA